MGGEHDRDLVGKVSRVGSSPRGRGTRLTDFPYQPRTRIIPAWAGNTPEFFGIPDVTPDHPRVGGEHFVKQSGPLLWSGSSPRGRGTQCCRSDAGASRRIIPAWAGNTSPVSLGAGNTYQASPMPDHPRVGGEHLIPTKGTFILDGSSPRGRGTHTTGSSSSPRGRIIPAWAGNTSYEESESPS